MLHHIKSPIGQVAVNTAQRLEQKGIAGLGPVIAVTYHQGGSLIIGKIPALFLIFRPLAQIR